MQEGSLVVIIRGVYTHIPLENRPFIKWLPEDNESTPYTIRTMGERNGDILLTFEEGVIGLSPKGEEWTFPAEWAREIQGPTEINVQEIVDEAVSMPAT